MEGVKGANTINEDTRGMMSERLRRLKLLCLYQEISFFTLRRAEPSICIAFHEKNEVLKAFG